jgi:16S rRNA G966 N2-methylase RsmD
MVESDRAAHSALEQNRDALAARQVELVRADAIEFVRHDKREYDVIFLDPPFAADLREKVLPSLRPRLKQEGCVYYESGADAQWPEGWRVHKRGRAGQVVFQLVKRT